MYVRFGKWPGAMYTCSNRLPINIEDQIEEEREKERKREREGTRANKKRQESHFSHNQL